MKQLPSRVIAVLALSTAAAADTLDEALALVPAEIDAAFVVPSLKRANDDLQACLERADRPETALLGRPLDLLKARLGVSVGVRDDGSLVGLARWPQGATEPILAVLVPVSDAEAFLRDNFEVGAVDEAAGGAAPVVRTVRRSDGMTLHVAQVADGPRRWVALSPDASGVQGLAVDAARADGHRAALGAGGERLCRSTEVLAWVTGDALRRGAEARLAEFQGRAAGPADAGEPAPEAGADDNGRAAAQQAARKAVQRMAAVQVAAMAWDIDALGLIGRGLVRIDRRHASAAPFAGGSARVAKSPGLRLGLLPGQPFYLAFGVDIAGLGGTTALHALEELLPGIESMAPWVEGAEELQMAVYPSKLGVTVGGILNDAAVVLRTATPSARRDALKARLESLQGEQAGVKRVLTWEADKPVKDGGTADAFELQQTVLPGTAGAAGADGEGGDGGSDVMTAMVTSVLLGSRGLHGYIKPFEDKQVLVGTFSQRPDVWRRAVAAATGDGASVGASATIEAMRGFALEDPDLELALGLGQLVKLAQQVAKSFGASDVIPAMDAGTEPIYTAMEVQDYTIEGACVIPAAVAGLIVDRAKREMAGP